MIWFGVILYENNEQSRFQHFLTVFAMCSIELGLVTVLVNILSLTVSTNDTIKQSAASICRNLSNCVENRVYLCSSELGLVTALVNILNSTASNDNTVSNNPRLFFLKT